MPLDAGGPGSPATQDGPKVEGSFNGLDGTVITCVMLEPCMYEKGKDAPSRRVEGPAEGF